jgi:hypothetical protein
VENNHLRWKNEWGNKWKMIIYGKHFHWKNDHLRWEMSGEMIIYAGK